jgi:cytochrome c-type biogenesis protein CcmF
VTDSVRRAPRWYGAYVAHLGVVMTFLAIAISSTFQVSREAHLRPGEQATIGDYALTLDRVDRVEQNHRTSERAILKVTRKGEPDGTLEPSMNFYPTQREPVGSPSVRNRWSHDLYITLMSVEPGGAAGIRAIVTPAVGWIWIGSCVLFLGMMLCLAEARREAVRGSTS